MKPEDVPQFIAAAIAAAPAFGEAGLVIFDPIEPSRGTGILVTDGSHKHEQGVTDALNTKGLVFAVGIVEALDPLDQVEGAALLQARVTVEVREVVSINRGQNGTGIRCDVAAVGIIRAVIKADTANRGLRNFRASRMQSLGVGDDGTWAIQVQLSIKTEIR